MGKVTKRSKRFNEKAKRYGLTPEQWEELFNAQGGVCAICHKPNPIGKDLAVDHDHSCCPESGRSCGKCVRALLCGKYNFGIAAFDDDPERVRNAAYYLSLHQERQARRRNLLVDRKKF